MLMHLVLNDNSAHNFDKAAMVWLVLFFDGTGGERGVRGDRNCLVFVHDNDRHTSM